MYQNRVNQKSEIERIQLLASTVNDFCAKSPASTEGYKPTPSMKGAVASWLKDATVNDIALFQSLSPAVRGLLCVALQEGLSDKLDSWSFRNSKEV